ncbi:MAG: hypothetical protein IM638_18085 [Bacteroidetes bacterium]|nr:hypothetical protein [Bacteroidota bacterium]
MDFTALLQRLGLWANEAAQPETPGQPLTLFQREQRLKALRTDAGNWLAVSEMHITVAAEAVDLPALLFPRTLCIAHNPASSISLVQMRSLLNRLRRTGPPGLHVVIVHASGLPDQVRAGLFGVQAEIEHGAAALIVNHQIVAGGLFGSGFETLRSNIQQLLL